MSLLSPYDGIAVIARSGSGGRAARAAMAALMFALADPLGPLAAAVVVVAVAVGWYPALGIPALWVLSLVGGRSQPSAGVLLRPRDHPELFALLGEVARRVGFDTPLVVRLVPVPDAGVVAVGSRRRRRCVLFLGWPYLRQLPARQLAAVLAHELAHELPGPDAATRWLLAARTALVDSLDRTVHPPRLLAAPLLARTRRYAFDVELAADAAAAAAVGTEACRDALQATYRLDSAFEPFAGWYLPRLAEAGEYPVDLYAAYADALADPLVGEWARRDAALHDAGADDPELTHPVLSRRVAALPPVVVDGPPGDPGRPVPVGDAAELDRRCVELLLDAPPGLTPVRLLDRDPGWFTPPLAEARSELSAATRAVTGRGDLDAALDAVASGAWRDVAARLERVPAHVPEPVARLALRDTYAGCLVAVLSGLLLEAGHTRVSRWSLARLRAPDGGLVDVRGLVERALDGGDPAPLRALAATGRHPGTRAAS
jgi:Zn-dependent protease with chaperone function